MWQFRFDAADESDLQINPPCYPGSSPAITTSTFTNGISSGMPLLMDDIERRRECEPRDVKAALAALELRPHIVRASDWPAGLSGLDQPGLYSWWADDGGAVDLTAGLGQPVESGRIYAGQT